MKKIISRGLQSNKYGVNLYFTAHISAGPNFMIFKYVDIVAINNVLASF